MKSVTISTFPKRFDYYFRACFDYIHIFLIIFFWVWQLPRGGPPMIAVEIDKIRVVQQRINYILL
jgi:hypothetical protein